MRARAGSHLLAGVQQGPGQARRLACGQGCFEVQVRLEHLVVGLLLQRGRQLLVRLRSASQTDECSYFLTAHRMTHGGCQGRF